MYPPPPPTTPFIRKGLVLLVIGTAVGTVLLYAVGADIWFLIKYLRQRLREREERERQREREERERHHRRAAFMTGLWWPREREE